MTDIDYTGTTIEAPEPDLTPETLLGRARELRERLIEEAPAGEERGGYSQGLHEAFTDAGFYRTLQPRRFGGYEFGVDTFFHLIATLAEGDPATAWSVCLASDHVFHIASFYSEAAQAELFAPDGHFCAPHRAAPTGKAEPVDGGYVVTGQWDYCSGVTHSSHFIATAMGPRPGDEGGEPVPLACVIPKGGYEILDDWGGGATIGLQGTGSNSVRVDQTFVPTHLAEHYEWKNFDMPEGGTPGYRLHGNPMYLGRSATMYFGGLAAPIVGAARAACADFEHILRTRPAIAMPGKLRMELPDYQRILGEALSLGDAAELVLVGTGARYTALAEAWARDGRPFTVADDAQMRGGVLHAGRLAAEAVERVFAAGGTGAARRGSRLQRHMRDVAMYRTHIGAQYDQHHAANGRVHLGLPQKI